MVSSRSEHPASAVASLFDLSGRTAFVTGGAQGIGRTCALSLAKAGADVAVVDVDPGAGERTVESIRALGKRSDFVSCDVTDQGQVAATVAAVVKRFGRLDIAVNNAAIYRAGDDEDYERSTWDQVLSVNLTGAWLCAQAARRQMASQSPSEGKIINIASIGANIACSNGAYDASKAALVHLTRVLAARWGRFNINVNAISPGYVAVGMGGNVRPVEERKILRELTPLGHVLRLEDLEGPVQFFASRASDFVTGQNLVVDGGHTLSTWLAPLERTAPPRVEPAGEIAAVSIGPDASAGLVL